jgi:hypothetical protein
MGVSGLPVRKTGMSACSREIPLTSDTSRQTLNAPSIAMLLRSSGPFRLAAGERSVQRWRNAHFGGASAISLSARWSCSDSVAPGPRPSRRRTEI